MPDGIHNKIDIWTVKWGGLTTDEKTTIETVLDAAGAWDVLLWVPVGETVEKKFINAEGSYSRTRKGNTYEIEVKLTQVFDNV
jgi:phage-related protein